MKEQLLREYTKPALTEQERAKTGKDLVLIQKINSEIQACGGSMVVIGGYGKDFILGEITRPHKDIDIVVLLPHSSSSVVSLDTIKNVLGDSWIQKNDLLTWEKRFENPKTSQRLDVKVLPLIGTRNHHLVGRRPNTISEIIYEVTKQSILFEGNEYTANVEPVSIAAAKKLYMILSERQSVLEGRRSVKLFDYADLEDFISHRNFNGTVCQTYLAKLIENGEKLDIQTARNMAERELSPWIRKQEIQEPVKSFTSQKGGFYFEPRSKQF